MNQSERSGQAFQGQWDPNTARILPSRQLTEVHLLRHGTVEAMQSRVVRGQLDVALTSAGLEQHACLAGWMREQLPASYELYSSDLARCRDLAQRLGQPVNYDARLREQHMGRWEGRTWAEISAQEPAAVSNYWADYAQARPTGGESLVDLKNRVLDFWRARTVSHAPVVLVTHIGVIRSLLCEWLGVPLDQALRFAPATASHTHVLLSDSGAVINAFGERPWSFERSVQSTSFPAKPRIALSGSAGTGKTTLGRRLAQTLGLPFLEERMRQRLESGFNLHGMSPQAWRALIAEDWAAQAAAEQAAQDGFVADRSSLDYAAFWMHYQLHENEAQTHEWLQAMSKAAENYDRIVLFPHGVLPLVDDGVRSTNPWTQLRFQTILEGVLERYAPRSALLRLPPITGLEARLEFVLSALGRTAKEPQAYTL